MLRQTNTMILNQVGTPPPTSVLLAVIEIAGGIPEVIVARMIEKDGGIYWDLEGLASEVVFKVNRHNTRSMWFGGTLEDDGSGASITAQIHRIDSVVSATHSLTALTRDASTVRTPRTLASGVSGSPTERAWRSEPTRSWTASLPSAC